MRVWSSLASSRRRHGPVLLGGALLALANAARSIVTIRHGFEDPDSRSLTIAFLASCCAALLIAGGLVWSPLYSRRVRREVADVVTNLHDVPGVGSLEAALAVAMSDPNLRVSYWLSALGMYSDAHGRPVREPSTGDGIVATQVMRGGKRIAVISQTGDAAELERVLGSDLRLALDNERLQAEVLAQMSDLRDSRARIVEAGDEGRRRLERDLHDGAQQSLLGLSYELRVARTAAATKPDDELTALLDSALAEVGQAFVELRELAHGIFPAELTQAGLGPAVASLTETSLIPVELKCDVTERLPSAVETAVYVLIAEGLLAATESLATSTTVTIGRRDGHIVVNVVPDRADVFTDIARATDRVGAIGGTLHIDVAGLRAEIPCAS